MSARTGVQILAGLSLVACGEAPSADLTEAPARAAEPARLTADAVRLDRLAAGARRESLDGDGDVPGRITLRARLVDGDGAVLEGLEVELRSVDELARTDAAPLHVSTDFEIDLTAPDVELTILPAPEVRVPGTSDVGTGVVHFRSDWLGRALDDGIRAFAVVETVEPNGQRNANERSRAPLTARVELSPVLDPNVHDLGDIVLSPAPALIAGRVVDGHGAPVAGHEVELLVRNASIGRRPLLKGRNGHIPDIVEVVEARTDERGRFQFHDAMGYGRRAGTRLHVSTEFPGRARDAFRTSAVFACPEPGDPHVELVLAGRGTLAIDVGALPRELRQHLGFEWTPSEGPPIGIPLDGFRGRRSARLPAADYDLDIAFLGVHVARLDRLRVPVNGECVDPRISALALSGHFERHVVQVVGVPDEPLHGVRLHYRVGDGWRSFPARQNEEGAVDVWLPAGEHDLPVAVTATGYGAVDLTGRAHGARVMLQPIEAIELLFTGDIPPAGTELTVSPLTDDLPEVFDEVKVEVEHGGRATVPLAAGVRYGLWVGPIVVRRFGHRTWRDPDHVFEVREGETSVML